jgi:hypothetical protein
MEDNLKKKTKKWKTTSTKIKMEDDLKKKCKKKWKTTSKKNTKNGRRPQNKQTNGRQPQKRKEWKTTSKKDDERINQNQPNWL